MKFEDITRNNLEFQEIKLSEFINRNINMMFEVLTF